MFKLTIFQSFWDGFLGLTSTRKWGGGGSFFFGIFKIISFLLCSVVVSMHDPETISDLC